MDIQGSLPLIVVLVVAGFLLGNMFAAKPKAHEVRTSDFRLLARQLGFNPKFVSRPDWLPAVVQTGVRANNHAVKNQMVTAYAVINDEWRLPLVRLAATDATWQTIEGSHALHGALIDLPKDISDHVVGLQAKANSVIIYWHDGRYQSWQGTKKLDKPLAKQELTALQAQLTAWGDEMNRKNQPRINPILI